MKAQTVIKHLIRDIGEYPGNAEEAGKYLEWVSTKYDKQKIQKKFRRLASNKLRQQKKKVKYREYLESAAWKSIRKRVLEIKGKFCEKCGSSDRINIHHTTYARSVMRGDSLKGLRVLCRDHHIEIHKMVDDEDISIKKATERLFK